MDPGEPDCDKKGKWVTTLKLQHSIDGSSWTDNSVDN